MFWTRYHFFSISNRIPPVEELLRGPVSSWTASLRLDKSWMHLSRGARRNNCCVELCLCASTHDHWHRSREINPKTQNPKVARDIGTRQPKVQSDIVLAKHPVLDCCKERTPLPRRHEFGAKPRVFTQAQLHTPGEPRRQLGGLVTELACKVVKKTARKCACVHAYFTACVFAG
jgi:hypothetical protein